MDKSQTYASYWNVVVAFTSSWPRFVLSYSFLENSHWLFNKWGMIMRSLIIAELLARLDNRLSIHDNIRMG